MTRLPKTAFNVRLRAIANSQAFTLWILGKVVGAEKNATTTLGDGGSLFPRWS